jgi:hypothetical protein
MFLSLKLGMERRIHGVSSVGLSHRKENGRQF